MDLQTPTPEPQRKVRPVPLPKLPSPNKISAANQTCWYMGAAILATGIVGFVVPGLFMLHLNPVHNLILIASGAISIWVGLTAVNFNAKRFCQWFGAAYILFGLAGFAFGHRALSLTRPTTTGLAEESSFLWQLVPGRFELGTGDHVLHLIIGAVFLISGFLSLRGYKRSDSITWH